MFAPGSISIAANPSCLINVRAFSLRCSRSASLIGAGASARLLVFDACGISSVIPCALLLAARTPKAAVPATAAVPLRKFLRFKVSSILN
jgi:hypothetical protein